MRGLLWCLYAVSAVSGATITTTSTYTKLSTVISTQLYTVTSTKLSTFVSTTTSTKLSTTTASGSTVYISLPASTVSITSTRLITNSLPASTTTLQASTITLQASTTTLPASTITLPASTITLPASTSTLQASTITLQASTTTLPASTVTLQASTIILPASTNYVTLPASSITLSASTSYVTVQASTVVSTVTAPISYITLPAISITIPGSTVYVTISGSGTSNSYTTSSVASNGSTPTYLGTLTSSSTSSSSSSTSSIGSSAGSTSSYTTSTLTSLSPSSSFSGTSNSYTTGTLISSSASSSSSSTVSTGSSSGSIGRTATAAPATTPSGTVLKCYQWHVANSWDTCVLIQGEFGISASNFLAWNPSINSACSNLITGDAYCVDGAGNLFTSPTATAPNAVVTGIISPCYRYHTITSSDYCSLLQLEFGISFDVLRAWNPSINNACNNLVIGSSYCVDGAGHSTLPSTVSPSTSTSSGTTSTCYQYRIIVSSDTCSSIQTTFGLTFDLFRVWNTQINNACSNLLTGYSYCVDGSGLFTTVSTVTSSSSTSSMTLTLSSTSSSTSSSATISTGRAVFAHYMVGTMTSDEAVIDVQKAQAMGIDAFALNVVTATDTWSNNAVASLFAAAQSTGFKLFFSFDMSHFNFPSDFIPLIKTYVSNSAYYNYNGLPFVSTFNGGDNSFGYGSSNAGWQAAYKDVLTAAGISTFFVPDFSDSSIAPSSMYSSFPVADGFFNWEGSWPTVAQGKINVSSTDDAAYISAAKSAGKKFMMGISPLQFKHMNSDMNYVRRGGLNFALRISQILSLAPDLVEIQTWNDAGEGHYIGPVWNESIAGSSIGSYTWGYDHWGWQVLMTPMLNAYKAGYTDISNVVPTGSASVQGVFWHSTLLSTASCSGDPLGKPYGYNNLDDTIAVAVLVAQGISGLTINVYSGGTRIGSYATVQGLNAFEVFGMGVGAVKVEVLSSTGSTVLSATGSIMVQADSNNCNYNPQVVALS